MRSLMHSHGRVRHPFSSRALACGLAACVGLVAFAPRLAHAQDADPVPCALGSHPGIPDADAATAGRLVCADIARESPPPGARYQVELGKLGSTVILSVTREGDRPGTVAASRELRLQSLEEVSVAAPRVAAALVHDTPLTETETTENLVGEETREPKSKPGTVHAALGLIGLLPPLGQGLSPAAGVSLDVHYEARRIELGAGLRGGGSASSSTDPSMGYFQATLGGRYFFVDTDVAPYVGGGLQWMFLSLNVPSESFSANNGGLGGYVDGGVEILRTHHTHLAVGGRLDLPFFALNNSQGGVSGNGQTVTSRTYYAPLSLEVRLTF